MRKKLFTFLLALVTSVGLMNAAVDDSGSCGDNVTYSFNGTTGEMVISGTGPMAVYTYGSSLLPWKDYKDAITSVVVEDGVTSVSQYSFGLCTNLTTVVIGNDVETIGQFAFNDCGTSFTSLTLGSSLKSVGMAAFLNAKGITTLTLPDGFETVGDYAFCRLEALQTLNIPSSVTSIGTSAFYRCYPLATINCAAVTPPSLGDDAFGDIANKSNIPLNVPKGSVAAYTAAAQWNAFNIQGYDPAPAPTNVCGDGLTWELNGGVLTISYDGVGTGEMYDFGYEYDENPVNVAPWKENKSAITTVIVGDGVKSIGNYAFNDLYENFTAVTIANSVERIGVFAFTNAKWITEITLPSSLKTIDRQCFSANFGITSITIPSGVTSIGYQAFSYCKGLTSLTCEATTPPTLDLGVFSKIRPKAASISSIPLYVPSESVAAYEAAAQWNAFDIQAIPAPAPSGDKLSGVFSVSGTKAVNFSKGNLQYDSDNQIWQFAANQWDYIGNEAGNNAITSAGIADNNGIVDMFCWVGASSSLEGIKQYGIINAWSSSSYGSVAGEALKSDWGNTMGGDWRTLTKDEWIYLLTERTNAANLRTLGTVNGKAGLILMPDGWTASGVALTVTTANYTTNDINTTNWATLEGQGCVFLPAAGCCTSGFFDGVGGDGSYWSSTSHASGATYAHRLHFRATDVDPTDYVQRYNGMSVRLVSETTPTPTPTGEQVPTNADPENPSYHYSTFFHSTQNYKLSNDGTQAFIADLSNNELVLTEIAHGEQVIPANTAVILRKTGSADPVVLVPTQENGAIINPDDNSLEGVDDATTLASLSIDPLQCYVLSGKSHDETESGVGFYRIHGNTLKAHKAYVIFAGGSNNAPKKMRFVYGQATGIEDVQGNNVQSTKVIENGVLYIIRDGKTYNAMGQVVK
jgi:hypothetical protein